jgi:type II secretory pathway component PulC
LDDKPFAKWAQAEELRMSGSKAQGIANTAWAFAMQGHNEKMRRAKTKRERDRKQNTEEAATLQWQRDARSPQYPSWESQNNNNNKQN